jgi:hypothetical protein
MYEQVRYDARRIQTMDSEMRRTSVPIPLRSLRRRQESMKDTDKRQRAPTLPATTAYPSISQRPGYFRTKPFAASSSSPV